MSDDRPTLSGIAHVVSDKLHEWTGTTHEDRARNEAGQAWEHAKESAREMGESMKHTAGHKLYEAGNALKPHRPPVRQDDTLDKLRDQNVPIDDF
ncbi:unnamed protein product, partial [Mesorhabditis spiculigera]